MKNKVSVVIWTVYLASMIINYHKGITPSWSIIFIPVIVLAVSNWVNYIVDLIFEDDRIMKWLIGDRWEEYLQKWDEIDSFFKDDENKNEDE